MFTKTEDEKLKFFKLKTYHGTEVNFCKKNRVLKQSRIKEDDDIDFLLFRSVFHNDIFIGFPINIYSDSEKIKPDETNNFKKRLFVFSTGCIVGNKLSLVAIENKKFLSADTHNNITFDKLTAKEWEFFHLEESELSVSEDVKNYINSIDNSLSNLNNSDLLLYNISLIPKNITVEVFDLLLDFLSKPQLDNLIIKIKDFVLRDAININKEYKIKVFFDKIIECFPFGWWVSKSIRDICIWDYYRNEKYFYESSSEYDFLGYGNINIFGTNIYWGSKLIGLVRESIVSRKKLAVLATARDEGLYLLEWIAHNKVIGVDHFFIYTNDNTDGSDELLKILSENKEITWINNSGSNPPSINMQFKAYNHALNSLPNILDYEWCAVIDLDEVINTHSMKDKSIIPVISSKEKQSADCISLSWRVAYPNKNLIWENDFSSNRFVNGERHPLVKSIFKTSKFNTSYAHHPECSYELRSYYTCDGNKYEYTDFRVIGENLNFCDEGTNWSYICHYHIRSLEEYIWKFSRGENDGNGVLKIKKFRYNNPGIFNLFLDKFHSNDLNKFPNLSDNFLLEFNRIKSIPGVDEAFNLIINKFKENSLVFVEESVLAISYDDRIDDEIKRKWSDIVSDWRKERR